MAGPRYTIAQTRARVAALEIAAMHLSGLQPQDDVIKGQYLDVIIKLMNEATRLKAKAQEARNGK